MTRVRAIEILRPGPPGEGMDPGQVAELEDFKTRMDPEAAGVDGQFAVWDSDVGRVGWFGMPVLISSWPGHKIVAGGSNQESSLNSFFEAAAANGMGAVLMPGVYTVDGPVLTPDNLVLTAYGATIKRAAGWEITAMFNITDCENVTVRGLTVDGTRSAYTPAQNKHNIYIRNAHNVTLEDVVSIDSPGDGFDLADQVDTTKFNTNVNLTRVRSVNAARNGLSVIAGRHVVVRDSVFTGTNGVSPEAGLDIEPNYEDGVCEDIQFYGCEFSENTLRGVNIFTKDTLDGHQSGFYFHGGAIRDNAEHGLQITKAHSADFYGVDVIRNGRRGVTFLGNSKQVSFFGGVIAENDEHGLAVAGDGTATLDGLKMIGTQVRDNGQDTGGSYDGITLGNIVTRALIQGVTSTGSSQRYGIATNTNTQHTSIVDNNFEGNGTAATSILNSANRPTLIVRGNRGHVTQAGGVVSVGDGDIITTGLSERPTRYQITPTVAGRIVAVTGIQGNRNLIISLTDTSGAAITEPEDVVWSAEVYG